MPYDSDGNFTRIHNWEDDRINDIDIVTDHHDEEDDNFAEGLSLAFLRDGRVAMKGDINAAGFKLKNLSSGTADQDAVNRSQLDNAIKELKNNILETLNTSNKLGDIKASLQNTNHGNWLLCNGQEVSRIQYSTLFSLIGTKFGAGDGVNTFNIPDYRGKFLRGLGGNSAADIYTTQNESLPNITGSAGKIFNGVNINKLTATGAFANSATSIGTGANASYSDTIIDLDFKASNSNSIYAGEHVTPINQAVNYFIKAKDE